MKEETIKAWIQYGHIYFDLDGDTKYLVVVTGKENGYDLKLGCMYGRRDNEDMDL